MPFVIGVLSVLISGMSMSSYWLVARGRLKQTYILDIVNGCVCVVFNVLIVVADTNFVGVAFFMVPAVWMIACSIIGLRRLRRTP